MRALKTISFFLLLTTALFVYRGKAQQPTPMIIVQAANTAAPPAPVQQPVAAQASPIEAAAKALEQVKATNEETLKKQEEMLQQLDELQKAVEQLKIFSKRG